MARPKRSSFYHTRSKLFLSPEIAGEILGYTLDQILEADWFGDRLAEKYLLLHDRKEIGIDGWRGWCFSRGVLRHGREQWRPEGIIKDRRFRESLEIESYELCKALKKQ